MAWVRDFYSTTGRWWPKADGRIGDRDHRRVAALHEHGRTGNASQVLELGSGYGTTAAAMALAGHAVTAVEFSDRADVAVHFADLAGPGSVNYLNEDFFQVRLAQRFDVVCYWDGFGVGSDADQRRLLTRIADDWLRPGGVALIDVFNPFGWAGWDGDLEHKPANPSLGYDHELYEECHLDPITCTAIDTWWPAADPSQKISQRLRCYTPADLALLLTGTGLAFSTIVIGDRSYPPATGQPGLRELLVDRGDYLAVLHHDAPKHLPANPRSG